MSSGGGRFVTGRRRWESKDGTDGETCYRGHNVPHCAVRWWYTAGTGVSLGPAWRAGLGLDLGRVWGRNWTAFGLDLAELEPGVGQVLARFRLGLGWAWAGFGQGWGRCCGPKMAGSGMVLADLGTRKKILPAGVTFVGGQPSK